MTTHRIVAGAVFLFALVLYGLTVAPTASFWDAGEFIAIANLLEVSHPPGAPFYMLVGRLFSMFAPTAYVALSVNFVSVLASAATVLLTHLIIIRLVREWQVQERGEEDPSPEHRIAALAGGVIGALTFAATDSFWFNAVEAEVYGLSMCFTALVVWLVMKWSEETRKEENAFAGEQRPLGRYAHRYLILISYLVGLAIGVHLLNLLAVFFIALIVYFTEIEKPSWGAGKRWRGILWTGCASVVIFLVVYPGVVQYLPTIAGQTGSPVLFMLFVIAAATFGVWYTHKKRWATANLIALSLAVVLIGYSSYALIFIRSAADPPIDENDPETTEAIVSYLKREQYGALPLLKGYTFDNRINDVDFSNEKFFPRRYSQEPAHRPYYALYDSDWEFFRKYQVGHMYIRYFLWQFMGRASDVQDAPPATGIGFIDERIGANDYLMTTPSTRASRNVYYALPLLLGLIGAGFHFNRDWRRALSVLTLFLITGLGIIVYLNQTPLQPRERDYAYVASFFAFSLWIGLGATGILYSLREMVHTAWDQRKVRGAMLALGAVLFLAAPAWMVRENWFEHDRSGNYVAPDYAWNMLNGLEEEAILFTNGDNDTFPLWYLQEVEGQRTDVRVVNLSLLNTPWYIRQLKNQWSRESSPLPFSMSDDRIDRIGATAWTPRDIELPVNTDRFAPESEIFLPGIADTNLIMNPMRWRLEGRPYNDETNMLYIADQASLDIVVTNAREGWQRPVYFAVTTSPDGQLGLQDFFHLEGQAFKTVPVRHGGGFGRVVPSVGFGTLANFRFRNLNNPNVYYDETTRGMVDNYRNIFAHTAQSLAFAGETEHAATLLDTLMVRVPFDTIPGDEQSYLLLARAYFEAGYVEKAVDVAKGAEPLVLRRLEQAETDRDLELAGSYLQIFRSIYLQGKDYDAASALSGRLADLLGDSTMRTSVEDYRRMNEEYERSLEEEANGE